MKYRDSELKYDGYLKIFKREMNGVEREVAIQGNGTGEAVALALFNKDKSKMLLVRQFRHPIGEYTWEIPAGMVDSIEEQYEECMIRELKEETEIELKPSDLKFEASFYPNIGVTNHKVILFSAVLDKEIDKEQYRIYNDDVVKAKWFDTKEIFGMIAFGEIEDIKTMFAYSLLVKE